MSKQRYTRGMLAMMRDGAAGDPREMAAELLRLMGIEDAARALMHQYDILGHTTASPVRWNLQDALDADAPDLTKEKP